jgi:hypothetical protein
MVFIGPASREDEGFSHSYDVVLDSYQQDEDLNDPDFYKMAGRVRPVAALRVGLIFVALPDWTPSALHGSQGIWVRI